MNFSPHIDLSRFSGKKLHIDPERDWLILLVTVLLLLAASAIGNALLYRAAVVGAPIVGAGPASASGVSQDALDKAEAALSDRATEEQKYESGTETFIDPSQ
ncbi:MAG: hypothetical protein ACREGR_02330 [Minisyncoccia bacterium]